MRKTEFTNKLHWIQEITDKTLFEHVKSKFGECRYRVHTEIYNFKCDSPKIGGGVVSGLQVIYEPPV